MLFLKITYSFKQSNFLNISFINYRLINRTYHNYLKILVINLKSRAYIQINGIDFYIIISWKLKKDKKSKEK